MGASVWHQHGLPHSRGPFFVGPAGFVHTSSIHTPDPHVGGRIPTPTHTPTHPNTPKINQKQELGLEHVPVRCHWRLNERSYGALVGLNKKECVAQHGAEQVKLWRRSFDVPPPPQVRDLCCLWWVGPLSWIAFGGSHSLGHDPNLSSSQHTTNP